MEVFVVVEHDYEDAEVVAVFSSAEKARAFVGQHPYYTIETWTVDGDCTAVEKHPFGAKA